MNTQTSAAELYITRTVLFGSAIECHVVNDGTSGTNSWTTYDVIIDNTELDEKLATEFADKLRMQAPDDEYHMWFCDDVLGLLQQIGWPVIESGEALHPRDEDILQQRLDNHDSQLFNIAAIAKFLQENGVQCTYTTFCGPAIFAGYNKAITLYEDKLDVLTVDWSSRTSSIKTFNLADPASLQQAANFLKGT